jgi:Ser/Thr protein kinase RdoA (MazF antagonist)
LGFEFIDGRHADYAPGSPDLDTVAGVVTGLGSIDCPAVVRMRVEQRYTSLGEDVGVLAGASLLHCDINPENVLITPDGRARLVDWAFTSRGAAWLELGFLLPWLLRAGHSAHAAEVWLSRFPAWTTADSEHIDLFASLLSRRWSERKGSGVAWIDQYVELTAAWAEHRLQPAPSSR